ncbi:MAG: PAS domain-containing protein [Croceibacterium sp.]
MERFILRHNIERYEERLAQVESGHEREYFAGKLSEWRRQLAMIEADRSGTYPFDTPAERPSDGTDRSAEFHQILQKEQTPSLLLDPGSGLRILDMNEAYAAATMTSTATVGGKKLFEVFPDNPDEPDADGVANLYTSLRMAAATGKPHTMAVQRYDIADGNGGFEVRYWQPVNTPIFNEQGELVYLLHQVEDVTSTVISSAARTPRRRGGPGEGAHA